jgi:peptidoglycan-associated lipoprotein
MRLKPLLTSGVSLCLSLARLLLARLTLTCVVLACSMLSGLTVACPSASAQSGPALDVGVNYNFVRSNAPPAGCGCFNLQGAGGVVLWRVSTRMEPLVKFSTANANAINSTSSSLRLTSTLFGVRSGFHLGRFLTPYGEAAVGVTHATGSVVTLGYGGGKAVIGATVGGGLLLDITPHLAIQAAQLDWYVTQVPNGVNNRQNNLLLTSGVLVRFGHTGPR